MSLDKNDRFEKELIEIEFTKVLMDLINFDYKTYIPYLKRLSPSDCWWTFEYEQIFNKINKYRVNLLEYFLDTVKSEDLQKKLIDDGQYLYSDYRYNRKDDDKYAFILSRIFPTTNDQLHTILYTLRKPIRVIITDMRGIAGNDASKPIKIRLESAKTELKQRELRRFVVASYLAQLQNIKSSWIHTQFSTTDNAEKPIQLTFNMNDKELGADIARNILSFVGTDIRLNKKSDTEIEREKWFSKVILDLGNQQIC